MLQLSDVVANQQGMSRDQLAQQAQAATIPNAQNAQNAPTTGATATSGQTQPTTSQTSPGGVSSPSGAGISASGAMPGSGLPSVPGSQPSLNPQPAPVQPVQPGQPVQGGQPAQGQPVQPQGLQMPTGNLQQAQGNPQFDQQGMLVPGTGGTQGTPGTPGQPVNFNNVQEAFSKATGAPPQTQGEASSAIQGLMGNGNPTAVQNATSFLNNNPTIQSALAQVTQALEPTNTTATLQTYVNQLQADQGILSGLNTQMMNLNNIMNGTPDDIRSEVTAANGFATDSQVMAMSTARNNTLLKQANLLQNQVDSAKQSISNDTNLLDEEQKIASEQFSENATIYNAAQNLMTQQQKASTDGINMLIQSVGLSGFVNGLMNADPSGTQLANAAQLLGLSPSELQSSANQQYYQSNLQQIQAAGVTTPYAVNSNGEVWNTQTGYAYTSPQDFQSKTGVSLDQANSKNQISSLTSGLAQKNALALQQSNLNLQKTQAEINSSNASAGSSSASAAKSAYDLGFEQANNGMTPAEVQSQNEAVGKAQQTIQDDASTLISKLATKTNPITWQDAYSELKTKYYPSDNSQEAANTIDKLLQANIYRK